MFCGSVYADAEGEVIVVTKVAYTASLTKKASVESGTVNPANGTHTGLSSVFTLQTNGGDNHFDYVITSYVDLSDGRASGYAEDGRLMFAHTTTLPNLTAYVNAKTGSGNSKNIFAYPTNVTVTGGRTANFETNYKDYGRCYVIYDNGAETGDVTLSVLGTPCTNTYEVGLDEAGTYKSTIVFTIASK